MIIRNVQIDNYGKYSGRSFEGFSRGVNVIFGPNEHGKTTLLEFVRRMLFGFPPGTYRKNRFAPVNGSKPGGRLVCELDSGEELIIERSGWTKGGALKLNNIDAGQRDLSDLLRAGESFYHNVYGITIEELYDIQSLNGEDIKNRIYGAGLDLGGISLAQIKRQLQADADRIFKPGGAKHLVHALNERKKACELQIKNGSEDLKRYEEIALEQEKLDRDREILRDRIKKISGFSEFIDYENLCRKLKNLPDTPAINEADIEEYQEFSAELKAVTGKLTEKRAKQLELQDRFRNIKINPALPELAPEISILERSSERYRADRQRVGELAEQIDRLAQETDEASLNIASLWLDGEIPENFNFTLEFISGINEFEQDFSDLRQKRITADALLQQQAHRKTMPGNLLPLIFIGVLDLLMIAAGIVINSIAVIAIAALLAVPAVIAAAQSFSGDRDEDKNKPGPLERKAAELETQWLEFLARNGFRETPAPRDLLNCAEIYKNRLKNQNDLAALKKELENKKLWLA
ncbi:MAG: AAA family ATPase, partial [Victivallaceae bacterium]|nr:AAA family ATPase [Victivallaceae bacterium]